MNNWIILTILYAFFVSLDEVLKKKATKINSVYEVLACFTPIALILTFIITNDIFDINYHFLPIIFLKSTVVVIAWVLGLKALDGLQLGTYGIIKASRIIFSIFLSCIFLNEKMNLITLFGILIIIIGLILVSTTANNDSNKKNSIKLTLLFLISCFCSSISAIMDKKILLHISSGQLQFWFLLFLTFYYWIIILIKRKKINYKILKNNPWIILIALCLVIADRLLFMANKISSSQVIIMTIIKQLSIIISIILGKIIFKEKNIIKKLLYASLILFGIVITIVSK